MLFRYLIKFTCLQYAVATKCQSNFSDRILNKSKQAYVDNLHDLGKGSFPSGCTLLELNTTTYVECDECIFGTTLSRTACTAIDYPENKVPNTYIELEQNGSKEDVEKIGGSKSSWYSRELSRNNIFFLPYSTVYVDVENYRIRDINEQSSYITLDIGFTMSWMDKHIFTHNPFHIYNLVVKGDDGFEIYPGATSSIWIPNLPISNLSDYKAFHESIHMSSIHILRTNYLDGKFCIRGPMLSYKLEAKISFYCDFDLSNYPLDVSVCSLRIGGESSNIAFKWSMDAKMRPNATFSISEFIATVSMAEDKADYQTRAKIGLDIKITRLLKPFVLKYYIPCIAIVIMSQLSFIIPLESLPARVGLVVTQFLTLISLFIQQMVNKLYHNLGKLVQNKNQ